MKPRTVLVVILALALFTLAGCATMGEVIKSKEEGTVQVYSVPFDRAWDIALTVLRWEDCETIEEHKSQNYMLTTTGQNFVSAGTLIGVWVEPLDSGATKVTIVTKRRIKTNLATGLTESTFHRSYSFAVDLAQSGKPLPIERPASIR